LTVIVVAAAAAVTGTATSQARPSSAVVASARACRNPAAEILFIPVSSQASLLRPRLTGSERKWWIAVEAAFIQAPPAGAVKTPAACSVAGIQGDRPARVCLPVNFC